MKKKFTYSKDPTFNQNHIFKHKKSKSQKKNTQTQHRDIIKNPNPRNANRSNTPINEIPKTKKQFK